MKVADYIVKSLKNQGIYHYFGFQGTMIAHFIDSIGKDPEVINHSCYNEQGAAFAAVGMAKYTGKLSVAYATSGPGALNLVSGIADAYFDSVPVLFITGQLNTTEYTDVPELRQQGFQQTDVVAICSPITKYCVKVEKEEEIPKVLEEAVRIAYEGRKGPVLIDIPMNIQRGEIDAPLIDTITTDWRTGEEQRAAEEIARAISKAKHPLLLLGNGIRKDLIGSTELIDTLDMIGVPVITSLLGRDILPFDHDLNFGFLGSGYGHRYTNILAYKKADLIVSLGSSFCRRQTGNPKKFAAGADIIRVDLDPVELRRKVHEDERTFIADANEVLRLMADQDISVNESWIDICRYTREVLSDYEAHCEERYPNHYIDAISDAVTGNASFVVDVGQHMMWAGQSLKLRKGQRLLVSGGHGAMGFSLPASIGAYYTSRTRTYCIAGDGAIQMNIQELQWLSREKIPVTVIVMNNQSLGLIEQQQDDFFDCYHIGATREGGFSSPSFARVAEGYRISSLQVSSPEELKEALEKKVQGPLLIEVVMKDGTKAYPKTYFGEEMYNQKPYIDKDLLNKLLELED